MTIFTWILFAWFCLSAWHWIEYLGEERVVLDKDQIIRAILVRIVFIIGVAYFLL